MPTETTFTDSSSNNMHALLQQCAAALRQRHFEVAIAANRREALAVMQASIRATEPETISSGDSATMYATGIVDWVRMQNEFHYIDGFDPSMPRPERIELRRQGLMADLFITGINALTTQGTLHWLDMIGNRVAPIAFGPRKVILVAGRNKVVDTADQARERIRTIAAPQNIARHPGFKTPCAVTGVCSDCNSPDRICNIRLELERCYPPQRILVVLIDEDLGL